MSATTTDRQRLIRLLGAEGLADLDLDRGQLSEHMLALLDEAFAGSTPVADLVPSALDTDGTVIDEAAYDRLLNAAGVTR